MERELEFILGKQNHHIFIAQRLREWREILEREDLSEREKAEIRTRIRNFKRAWLDMVDTLYGKQHGHEKASDERVSKLYDAYLTSLHELQDHYELWGKHLNSMAAYLDTPYAGELLVTLPGVGLELPTDKAQRLLTTHNASWWALHFTSQSLDMSVDRVRKKIKRMYRK